MGRTRPFLAGVLVGSVASLGVVAAVSYVGDDTPTVDPPSSADGSDFPEERDPLTWPYPSDSIWNMPRGADADLVPVDITAEDLTVQAEEDLLFLSPDAEGVDVVAHDADWNPSLIRCDQRTDEVLLEGLPIPDTDFTTEGAYTGTTPNHSTAVVMPDYTLMETQPLHVCEDGTVVSQYASPTWQGSSILTGGTAEDVGQGAHGGSGLTAFGGTIRLGEWVPGGRIPHAVKIIMNSDELSQAQGGFRWPADRADAAYQTLYQGSDPEFLMGALLTLPADFDVEGLETEAAQILARTLRDYGGYIVDGAGMDTVGFAVEWGPQGRVRDEFADEWGYEFRGRSSEATSEEQSAFFADMERIYDGFAYVADNSPTSIGGAGERLAPMAPPLGEVEDS